MNAASEPKLLTALEHARSLAASRGHDRVATLHLLAGLLATRDSAAVAVVRKLGVDVDVLGRQIELSLPVALPAVDPTTLAYSANAARALESAARRAGLAGHDAIRTEDLLLALAGGQSGVATLMRACGLTVDAVREQLDRSSTPSASGLGFLVLDSESSTPAYQQIVDRIREAVAEGRLKADDRLPTVRQLAADLELAPGTTARAYQQLEQLGIVTAEGPKGTRVARPRAVAVPKVERTATLVGLLRPVAVAASYLGASADEVHTALEQALAGIFGRSDRDARSA